MLLFPTSRSDVSEWRKKLKTALLVRDRYCYCGVPLIRDMNIDMHEGIVSRAEFMGMPKEIRILMYNELNCVLVCHDCNINHPPKRKIVWAEQYKLYGEELVKWYESLQPYTKHKLRRFYPE